MAPTAKQHIFDEYGPYDLKPPPHINLTRSIQSIKTNTFPNYFANLGYSENYNQSPEITYIRFPIGLGILSCRTCLVPTEILNRVTKINTLGELRKLTLGQGRGWVDVSIPKHNGFKVVAAEPYPILFKMVAAHRFDLLCRGANEVKDARARLRASVTTVTCLSITPCRFFSIPIAITKKL